MYNVTYIKKEHKWSFEPTYLSFRSVVGELNIGRVKSIKEEKKDNN